MRKILLLLFLFVLSFLIISCNVVESDTNLGTEGIVVSFADDLSYTIYEGSPLSIVVNVNNKGRFDEPYGRIVLSGFDPFIMPFSELAPNNNYAVIYLPEIEGVKPYNEEGGFETISFEILANNIYLSNFEKYEPKLMLSSCYYYETTANPTVCISSDPFNTKLKICDPFKPIIMQSQGAPVAVTKIEQEPMKDFVNFIVTIEHIGNGNIVNINQESVDACPFLKHNNMNEVEFEMNLGNTLNPECTPNDKVRLVNGKAVVFCKFQLRPESSQNFYSEYSEDMYTKQLEIKLKYFYNTNVYKTLKISKTPGTYAVTNTNN
jgi:hypothetical protein